MKANEGQETKGRGKMKHITLAILLAPTLAANGLAAEGPKPKPKLHKAEYAAAFAAIGVASAAAYFDVQSTRSKQLQYPGRFNEAGSPLYSGSPLVPTSAYFTMQIPSAAMTGVLAASRGHSRVVSWAIIGASAAYSVWHFQAAAHNRGLR
jgi:hypothetical protein